MEAIGPPTPGELALLEPYRDRLPAEVFGEPFVPPVGDGSGNIRDRQREALTLLQEAGWRVGLYTSPHLVSFRERIRVDDVPISEAAVAMWTERLRPLILERKATFFEASTVLAFADFAARGAEIAVVEVGLGGRLDSTNVVRPLVSAVTKIERDHMKYLGNTLEKIACEKAGITAYVPEKAPKKAGQGLYEREDFRHDEVTDTLVCPQGQKLLRHEDTMLRGEPYKVYYNTAACRSCALRAQCTSGKYRKISVPWNLPTVEALRERCRHRQSSPQPVAHARDDEERGDRLADDHDRDNG